LGLNLAPSSTSTSAVAFSLAEDQPTQYVGGAGLPYVFAGASFGSDNGLPFWSEPTSNPAFSNIDGGDMNDSALGYVTVSSTGAYLGTVQFEVPMGADTGQTFLLTLGGGGTLFDDLNGNPLGYTASFIPSASGGTVNIDISTASVPEPSSLAMAAIASLGGLLVYRRSRR
jgi:hypothetical protein